VPQDWGMARRYGGPPAPPPPRLAAGENRGAFKGHRDQVDGSVRLGAGLLVATGPDWPVTVRVWSANQPRHAPRAARRSAERVYSRDVNRGRRGASRPDRSSKPWVGGFQARPASCSRPPPVEMSGFLSGAGLSLPCEGPRGRHLSVWRTSQSHGVGGRSGLSPSGTFWGSARQVPVNASQICQETRPRGDL